MFAKLTKEKTKTKQKRDVVLFFNHFVFANNKIVDNKKGFLYGFPALQGDTHICVGVSGFVISTTWIILSTYHMHAFIAQNKPLPSRRLVKKKTSRKWQFVKWRSFPIRRYFTWNLMPPWGVNIIIGAIMIVFDASIQTQLDLVTEERIKNFFRREEWVVFPLFGQSVENNLTKSFIRPKNEKW